VLLDVISGDGNRRKELGFKRQFVIEYFCLVKIIVNIYNILIKF
jgi:hypothetical protein